MEHNTKQHDPYGGECSTSRPTSSPRRRGVLKSSAQRRGPHGENCPATSRADANKRPPRGLRLRFASSASSSCDIGGAIAIACDDRARGRAQEVCGEQQDAAGDGTDGRAPCDPASTGDCGEELRGVYWDIAGEANAGPHKAVRSTGSYITCPHGYSIERRSVFPPPILVSKMRHVPREHSLANHTEQHDPHGGDCWTSLPRSASRRRGVNGEKALTTSPPETGKPTPRGLQLRLPRADPPSCDVADAPVTERGDKGCAGQRDATGDGTDGSAPCDPAQLGDSGEELRGGERDAAGEAGADAI